LKGWKLEFKSDYWGGGPQAAVRRRRWEAALVEAKASYDEQARWDAFLESSRAWRAVREHRKFLAAAREAARVAGDADGMLTRTSTSRSAG
jgi:hypothetical protein